MIVITERDPAGPGRRRLPIQIANEAKMIRATVELLGEHDVGDITSRMIAERSGTATNYISRYFGGRDALLAATARELGWRIAAEMDGFGARPDLQEPLAFLEAVVSMPEVALWFKLFRYLSARNLTSVREPGSRSAVAVACDDAVARIFRIEGEDVQFWSNVFLTYMLGGLSFNALLGTDHEEGGKVLAKLGRVVEVLRDEKITLDA
jgi:AcrR family transcriptional regulator